MSWDDLRIFLAVARCGTIARAASELKTDPTTVSRRIQRLERDVGLTLIERHHSGPRLTPQGHRLATRAAAMDAAAQGTADDDEPGRLVVRVSAAEGFGTWFVAENLPEFLNAHAAVEVELVATSGFLNPSRRETDIAVLLAKPRKGPLVTRKLSDYTLRLYASEDHLKRHGEVCDKADLRRRPLVGYIPDILYAPELDYLDEIETGLRATIKSSSINAQHRLVAAGSGIGVLPCFIGDRDPRLAVVLPELRIERTFWLSIHRDVRQRPPVRQIVDWLVQITQRERGLLRGDEARQRPVVAEPPTRQGVVYATRPAV